jgi:Na+/H+-dicarboxylate symporter
MKRLLITLLVLLTLGNAFFLARFVLNEIAGRDALLKEMATVVNNQGNLLTAVVTELQEKKILPTPKPTPNGVN